MNIIITWNQVVWSLSLSLFEKPVWIWNQSFLAVLNSLQMPSLLLNLWDKSKAQSIFKNKKSKNNQFYGGQHSVVIVCFYSCCCSQLKTLLFVDLVLRKIRENQERENPYTCNLPMTEMWREKRQFQKRIEDRCFVQAFQNLDQSHWRIHCWTPENNK